MGLLSDIENKFRNKLGVVPTETANHQPGENTVGNMTRIDMPSTAARFVPVSDNSGSFHVVLDNTGTNKISVIKVIRDHTDYSLAEAKGLVESTPCKVYTGSYAAEAQLFCDDLIAAGATARVTGSSDGVISTAVQSASYSSAGATGSSSAAVRVILDSYGRAKIAVIKVVREHTGFSLAQAKNLVESAPCEAYSGMSAVEAQRFCDDLIAAGAIAHVL